ncbi:MAG: hypothetical protein M1826_002884 [Phylliscum demangeonii]|nr:MAG: hypothetical protein M1826_002884 [Phylliscum demangeonii]
MRSRELEQELEQEQKLELELELELTDERRSSPRLTLVHGQQGSGNLGSHVLAALIQSKQFNVTVVTRKESEASFDASHKVLKVDYTLDALAQAFSGQDAVVSTIRGGDEKLIIDAAIQAGVTRFLPSEFDADTTNQQAQAICPMLKAKTQLVAYLQSQAKQHPDFSWTAIQCGAFYDWVLRTGFMGLDLQQHTASIWDGGATTWSATTLATIGRSVVGVLTHLPQTKNRYVRIHSFTTSQNEVLAVLEHVGGGKTWPRTAVDALQAGAEGRAKLARGDRSGRPATIRAYVMNGQHDCGGDFSKAGVLDNELLGLPVERMPAVTQAIFHERL